MILNEKITYEQAEHFYHKLCCKIYGDSNKCCGGVMSEELIASHMNIDISTVKDYCKAMIKYHITERQGGMIVV